VSADEFSVASFSNLNQRNIFYFVGSNQSINRTSPKSIPSSDRVLVLNILLLLERNFIRFFLATFDKSVRKSTVSGRNHFSCRSGKLGFASAPNISHADPE
jgi:hypothetical protein